jgi:hypothetical protein
MSKGLKLGRHLDESALAELWCAEVAGEPLDDSHLNACAACRARYTALVAWAESIREDAVAEADEAFPPERLTAQQAHILRRLEAMGRPARVIAFPSLARPISTHHSGARRWIAAAAVAGLVIGLAGGQIFDLRHRVARTPSSFNAAARLTQSGTAAGPSYQRVSLTSDEAVLMEIGVDQESANATHMPEPLRALDELTPHARDYDTSK